MMKSIIATVTLVLTTMNSMAQTYLDPNASVEDRVEDALKRMTVEEKIDMFHATGKFVSLGVPRLGIRQINHSDGPHGCRGELNWNDYNSAGWENDYIVAFPALSCLASTWNKELSSLYGDKVSEEFAFRNKTLLLGPGVSLVRTPLCGRNFEYMGEDPFLAGEMAVPYIQAVQKNGIGCCLKHFFLNNQETDRFTYNANVSERAVREIYLPAFSGEFFHGISHIILVETALHAFGNTIGERTHFDVETTIDGFVCVVATAPVGNDSSVKSPFLLEDSVEKRVVL